MPADTNPAGDIFGGWVMSQMDIAGAIAAVERAKGRVVTVAVEAMTFIAPVKVGDILCVYTTIERVGTTSITVAVEAWARRNRLDDRVKVTDGHFVYVALGEDGQQAARARRPEPPAEPRPPAGVSAATDNSAASALMRTPTKRTLLQRCHRDRPASAPRPMIFLPAGRSRRSRSRRHALRSSLDHVISPVASGKDLQTWRRTGWGRCAASAAPLSFSCGFCTVLRNRPFRPPPRAARVPPLRVSEGPDVGSCPPGRSAPSWRCLSLFPPLPCSPTAAPAGPPRAGPISPARSITAPAPNMT